MPKERNNEMLISLRRIIRSFLDLLDEDVDFDSEHGAEQDEEQEERDDDR